MSPLKTFKVFGEPVDILVSGEMSGGLSATFIQTSPPGGGPPPHSHRNEDETFIVLEGEYEFLQEGRWTKVAPGEAVHATRGGVHTFRNVGSTMGRMLFFATPAGLEKYLEEISKLSVPEDMPQVLAVSDRYGIAIAT